MDAPFLIALLALATMGIFVITALFGKSRTEARRKDDDAPKSRLAKDAPNR